MHKFGHALECIHEAQNPKGGTRSNEAKVITSVAGAPNYWSREDTFSNVIKKYSLNKLNASMFIRTPIMLYSFPGELIKGGKGTPSNVGLSSGDKKMFQTMCPAE